MEKLFINIFQMSISASYLILAVIVVRFLLRKAPKSMRGFLWLLVGIRLMIPFSIESAFSLIPDTSAVDAYVYDIVPMEISTITVDAADRKMPVTHPVQNGSVPETEKSMSKTQKAVRICTNVWLVGMILMAGCMVISWLRLKNRVKMAIPMDVVLDCDHRTRERSSLIKVYQTDAIESPFLFGMIKPRIYIPNHIADEELPYVIQHEMTHLKRRDYLVKPAGFLILSIYWFNPCVWIAYIMLCKDIELICDEKVIKQLGTSCKKAYSQALLNSASNRRMIAACPVAFGEVSVKERVKNVLHYKKPAFWVLAAAVLACIIVPVCFMTQKKTDVPMTTDDSEAANVENLGVEEIDLDGLLIAGVYEMFNPDQEKYLSTPQLTLDKDGRFSFRYDSLSSYLPYGDYTIVVDKLNAVTDDGNFHYQFTRADDGSLLIFDAEHSSDISRIDAQRSIDAPIENGSIFIKNTALTTLNNALDMSQTFHQELMQGTSVTYEDLMKKLNLMEEMKSRITMEEMRLKRQLEKSKELQLDQEVIAAVEERLQGLIQESENCFQQLERDQESCQSMMKAVENDQTAYKTIDDVASIAPYIVTGENVDAVIAEDAKQLEALFPNHHEFVFNTNLSKMIDLNEDTDLPKMIDLNGDTDFPKMIDLNGDGVAEKIEMVNLLYNGGDGGYALKVTDTKTGKQIPLPDGYTEENGFPVFTSYIVPEGNEPLFLIQLGDEKNYNTLATIMQDALIRIYERNNMYEEVKEDILNGSNKVLADAVSGCNIVTYNNEEIPVILLKSYISGFAGHADTLGYVITELRLQKDNTWAYSHCFLLDSCDDLELSLQQMEVEAEEDRRNGISILPFDKKSDINFQLLLP